MRTGMFLLTIALTIGCPATACAWGWIGAFTNASGSTYDVPNEPQATAVAVPDILEPWRPAFRFVGNDSGFSIVFGQRTDNPPTAQSLSPWALGLHLAPNPARSRALLTFTLPLSGIARLSLIDVCGRVVETLFHEPLQFGTYERRFAPNVPTGQYVLRLSVDDKQATMKVIVLH